jgi:hypothetical protein
MLFGEGAPELASIHSLADSRLRGLRQEWALTNLLPFQGILTVALIVTAVASFLILGNSTENEGAVALKAESFQGDRELLPP